VAYLTAWRWHAAVAAGVASGAPLHAQTPPIQDNSFLVEEAYNQGPGVVQHISTFTSSGGAWVYGFTQEWPLGGMRSQGSYTLALAHDSTHGTGPGDVALNYRYQLIGTASSADRLFLAPRVSVLLPTGSWRAMRGSGSLGLQVNLPASLQLSSLVTAHLNAGATFVPRARDVMGARAATWGFNLAGSTIWAVRPDLNLMLEGVWLRTQQVAGDGVTTWSSTTLLNPGVRWALNFRSGLQVVPGVAWTVDVGPDSDSDGLFLYLSFEHPFRSEQQR
jgi:hypothetical protein